MPLDAATALVSKAEAAVGRRWLARVRQHLAASIDKELRAGAVPVSTDVMAANFLKGVTDELEIGEEALRRAAMALKNAGRGVEANHAVLMASRLREAVNSLMGH